jgi:hypothetical protein
MMLADMGSDWSLAGSIMTFAIPVGLFVVVAAILYFLYTRPHVTPGHRDLAPAGAGAGAVAAASAAPAPPAPAAPAATTPAADEAPAAEDATEDTE